MDLRNAVITGVQAAIAVHSTKGQVWQMKDRKCYGISLCLSGQITYVQNDVRVVSDCNHVVILPKGGSYTLIGDKTGDFPVINFECAEFLCDRITKVRVRNRDYLVRLYDQISRLLLVKASHAKVMSVFYAMLDALSEEHRPYRLLPALEYIENNFATQSVDNQLLANECGISEVYFRKLFLREMGCSPRQYIIELRLQRAKQLLAEDALHITEVAEACGFSSFYHFCRLFKERCGETPSEYRLANRILNV